MARDYSYNELLNMQEQAMRRVEQMQKSADSVRDSFMNNENNSKKNNHRENPHNENGGFAEVSVPNPSPQKETRKPSADNNGGNANNRHNVQNSTNSMFSGENPIKGLLDGLNLDDDKILLIGVLLLLSKEGADNSLIFSILYMLF